MKTSFTVFHCQARDISILPSESWHQLITYGPLGFRHIAGPSVWNSLRTLSATQTPPKELSGAC